MRVCRESMFITTAMVFFFILYSEVMADSPFDIACKSNVDCPYDQTCYRDKCLKACLFAEEILGREECAPYAVCYVDEPHTAGCRCDAGYEGDPYYKGCTKVKVY